MTISKSALAGLLALVGMAASPAHAIIITEFTGDDIELSLTFADVAGGVDVTATITSGSTYTGDITGLWLGLDDSQFDPSQILPSDVSVSVADFELVNPAGSTIAPGITLNGSSGIFDDYDLDIAVRQTLNGNYQPVTSLIVSITTAGIMASYFNEAGARVQSSTGPAGSSKLIGGRITQVPEPSSLLLLGTGMLLVGTIGCRRRRRTIGQE